MNVIWRTLLVILSARRRARREGLLDPTAVGRIRLTTLPTDLDILRHMNNGRYLSLFDLGRWDLLIRTGLFDAMRERGWYAVVSSETVTFRKSLELWQRFDVESRLIGHDDKAVLMEHRAVVGGEVYARVIVRARMLRRTGGTVPHDELFAAVGRPDGLPEVDPWIHDWAQASALPPTKAPAPSTWTA
ncbi:MULTISPECIES: acyl-CoA thioesterase [unclassified Microbacterium]|uniref:acyl-CoA thioesterase n=1 Tax=unclassified Microbacterium TaxID=2609290 RepID=UPI0022F0CC99|nr:acyl-CoA thioesterase [Streptomyces sp. MS2A]